MWFHLGYVRQLGRSLGYRAEPMPSSIKAPTMATNEVNNGGSYMERLISNPLGISGSTQSSILDTPQLFRAQGHAFECGAL